MTWVDINKGDKANPEYRSRLVAKGIKTNKRDDLFRSNTTDGGNHIVVVSRHDRGERFEKGKEEEGTPFECIDIKRACLQAEAKKEINVELLEEDCEEGKCATLVKAMYGTRDAAQISGNHLQTCAA